VRKILSSLLVSMLFMSVSQISHAADIAAGKTRAAQCAACHGPDGHAVMPQTPNLAGQDEDYLVEQLKAFRSGERQNETMTVIAKPLSDTEIANLAAYFHSLK
jgi:cytochrome c553